MSSKKKKANNNYRKELVELFSRYNFNDKVYTRDLFRRD